MPITSASARYKAARSLLIVGLLAIVVGMGAGAAIAFAIIPWTSLTTATFVALIVAGFALLIAAALLGAINIALLRRERAQSVPSEHFE
jgi:hypothetical protein